MVAGTALAGAVGRCEDEDVTEHEQIARQLWAEHLDAPFPARLRGEEIAGVEMVLLDADTAGSLQTWLGSDFKLDQRRRADLEDELKDLNRVVPLLDDSDERAYYERLRRLVRLALGFESPEEGDDE